MLPTEIKKRRTEARRGVNMYKDDERIYIPFRDDPWTAEAIRIVRETGDMNKVEEFLYNSEITNEVAAVIRQKVREIQNHDL